MDRGAWQATVRGVAKSQAQLCNYTAVAATCYILIVLMMCCVYPPTRI